MTLALDRVTASVPHFVAFEVFNLVETPSRLGLVASVRPRAAIAVVWMEMVIDVTAKTFRAMKPRASANEDATDKPLRAVIAVGSAVVRRDIIIAVGADGRDSNVDLHLSL
jgi:hypothetical protein